MWVDYWGVGGGQRVCWSPSQIIGGPAPLPPLPTPNGLHYDTIHNVFVEGMGQNYLLEL